MPALTLYGTLYIRSDLEDLLVFAAVKALNFFVGQKHLNLTRKAVLADCMSAIRQESGQVAEVVISGGAFGAV